MGCAVTTKSEIKERIVYSVQLPLSVSHVTDDERGASRDGRSCLDVLPGDDPPPRLHRQPAGLYYDGAATHLQEIVVPPLRIVQPLLNSIPNVRTLNLKHVSYLKSPLELHSEDVLGVVAVVDLPHDGHVRRTQLPGNKMSEQLLRNPTISMSAKVYAKSLEDALTLLPLHRCLS